MHLGNLLLQLRGSQQKKHDPRVERRHGDSLRSGWKNILACVMRLFQLDLLPPVVLLIDCEDMAAAKDRLPRPSASRKNPATASLLSRAFSRYSPTHHAPCGDFQFPQKASFQSEVCISGGDLVAWCAKSEIRCSRTYLTELGLGFRKTLKASSQWHGHCQCISHEVDGACLSLDKSHLFEAFEAGVLSAA